MIKWLECRSWLLHEAAVASLHRRLASLVVSFSHTAPPTCLSDAAQDPIHSHTYILF